MAFIEKWPFYTCRYIHVPIKTGSNVHVDWLNVAIIIKK